MPSLHHGAIFIGVFLIVTGGSTAFLASYQSRLQAFSLCCVVLGAVMLILGLFWAMNSKNSPAAMSSYTQGDYGGECPHYSGFNDYPSFGSNHLAVHMSESQSGFLPRTQRPPCAFHVEEFDYPPMDHGGFTAPPPAHPPPPWMGPPPPYEEAIKITCSSTNMRRAYSDTHLSSEPLFGRSREISFEV